MQLPEWVRAKCRVIIGQSHKTMADKVSKVREEAYKHGYLYDHVQKDFVYVGEGPEPRFGPPAAAE